MVIYFTQVILQSETIQELNKTSQALALVQEEASEMRKLADTCKSENVCNSLLSILLFYFCISDVGTEADLVYLKVVGQAINLK